MMEITIPVTWETSTGCSLCASKTDTVVLARGKWQCVDYIACRLRMSAADHA